VYLPPGWLFWERDGALVAQRFDIEHGTLTGEVAVVASRVSFDRVPGAVGASGSAAGILAYRTGGPSRSQLTWFDRAGTKLATFGGPDDASPWSPSLSPDGLRVVLYRTVQANTDVWLLDGTRASRLTSDASVDRFPVWGPDGKRIVFRSDRDGSTNLYVQPVGGREELLVQGRPRMLPTDWSADGRFLLFTVADPRTGSDLWALPMQGNREPLVVLQTNFNEAGGQLSPDGRWLAYQSDETGRHEVYVRPFAPRPAAGTPDAAPAGPALVSTSGGTGPRWSRDGRELYYASPDGWLMAAPVDVEGATIVPGIPVALFQPPIAAGTGLAMSHLDVAADGRFLINAMLVESGTAITLLQNWKPPVP
jgi:Tol biopolymer transport system component